MSMPTEAEILLAIDILSRARNHGGTVDILLKGELNLNQAANDLGLGAPEELMDCVLNVGNSLPMLKKFIEIR